MQIDWLTVGAQIVNFLVLVALLKRFLYRPLLGVMARREADIARRLQEAETREQVADARATAFQAKSDDLDRRRQELLDAAKADAEAERQRRLQHARAETREDRARWRAQLDREWADLRGALRRRLAGVVTDAARRALADLADDDFDRAMVRAFCRRLGELPEADRAAIREHQAALTVVTTFDPDDQERRRIADAVKAALGHDVQFARRAGVIGGIEISTDGWKVGWTIDDYLDALEDALSDALAVEPDRAEANR